jgi:hypothetical protein
MEAVAARGGKGIRSGIRIGSIWVFLGQDDGEALGLLTVVGVQWEDRDGGRRGGG